MSDFTGFTTTRDLQVGGDFRGVFSRPGPKLSQRLHWVYELLRNLSTASVGIADDFENLSANTITVVVEAITGTTTMTVDQRDLATKDPDYLHDIVNYFLHESFVDFLNQLENYWWVE